ncbi:TetR/AcrR family transcriptional regulator [Nocardiopsis potens]|uniref:TetR/AcrR family transcriptional regulator n=1 Tax=Nocardiopsis potens TaxID=1246458 RepID=UPI00034DE0FE|nr:TetR/AcrR family transcriptional regulator [Nocardiopsis potens]
MSEDTRTKLLAGALEALVRNGIAKTSARSIAAAAGVNQGLVFYHFGSVDELLAAACRYGAEQRVAHYRPRFAEVRSFAELVRLGRDLHAEERDAGHVATLAQLLAGAQTRSWLAPATAAGLELWAAELEKVLERVVPGTPIEGLVDTRGLARALASGFIGLELYEGVDHEGAERALEALERLGDLVAVLDDLGPVTRRAVRARLRGAAGGTQGRSSARPPASPGGDGGEAPAAP